MTSTLVLPGTSKIEGVFLLVRNDLLEIDEFVKGAKKEIDATIRRRLSAEVKNEMQRYAPDSTDAAQLEKVRKTISSSYPYKKHEHKVEVFCKSTRMFKARSFEEIADDPLIVNEHPTHAFCTYSNAGISLKVELLTGYPQGISIAVSPADTALSTKMLQQFTSWAETKRRVELWRRIAGPLIVLGLAFSFWLLLTLPFGVLRTVSERPSVVAQAHQLLEEGVDAAKSVEAIELLLRLETRHYVERQEFYFSTWWLAGLVVCIGAILATLLRPRSTIGLGKSVQKLKFYLGVAKLSKLALGVWGAAILCSVVANYIYDRF